ncbi:MAG TPA: hypothetical protein VF167_08755 [Longimicrobiaceae bacterium]
MRNLWLALALLFLIAGESVAQRLVVEGSTDHPAASALREIADRNDYWIIDRDTVLPATFQHEGDLVVVDATVRLEGTVSGSVAVVSGSFFIRPGARVGGVAVAVAGTIGSSALATVGDTLFLPLDYNVVVEQRGAEYRVTLRAPPRPPFIRTQGVLGVIIPSYDRVNGVTVRAGLAGGFGTDSLRPHYEVIGSYYSARGDVGATGRLLLPFGGRAHLSVSGGRTVETHDEWIRGDLSNSLSALLVRSDVRNYYESDFVEVRVEQLPPLTLATRQGYIVPRLGVRASRDRSLRARDPWTLFGDEPWRENPPVFEGTLTSALAGFSAGWRGVTSGFISSADLEWAFPSPEGRSWGERSFVQLVLDGRWTMIALWDHSLELHGHVMQSFGPDPAPPQRWSLIGGPGTLPTLRKGELRGDNLVFLQSTYAVPLRFLVLPYAGIPQLAARHAVGSAWVSNTDAPRWQQNVAVGVRQSVADLFLYLDPAEADRDPHFSISFHLPF